MGDQADLQNAFVDGDDVQILELNSEGGRTVDVDASVGNVRRRVCVAGSAWRGAVCPILLIPLSVPLCLKLLASSRVFVRSSRCGSRGEASNPGIFSCTPELHVAFCPIFVHPLFPCLNPIFKNGSFLSVVALVSVTLLDWNRRPSPEKKSILVPTPSSSPPWTATVDFPERTTRGKNNRVRVF